MTTRKTKAEQNPQTQNNAWLKYTPKQRSDLNGLCRRYEDFLSACKTERECVERAVEMAKKAGYTDLREAVKKQRALKAGLPCKYEQVDGAVQSWGR